MTDNPPAPEKLLNIIHCNCDPSTDNACGSLRCTCRKHGVPCLSGCGRCKGELCTNCFPESASYPNPGLETSSAAEDGYDNVDEAIAVMDCDTYDCNILGWYDEFDDEEIVETSLE